LNGPTFDDIRAARKRLEGLVAVTPCPHSETLSLLTGARVFVKLENLQMTGSFKERGAANMLPQLSPEEQRRGWWPPPPAITVLPSPIMPTASA